jgi:hypothetical protein
MPTYDKNLSFEINLLNFLCCILLGEKIPLDVSKASTGELLIPARRKITKTLLMRVVKNYEDYYIDPSPIRNKLREYIAECEKHNPLNHTWFMGRVNSEGRVEINIHTSFPGGVGAIREWEEHKARCLRDNVTPMRFTKKEAMEWFKYIAKFY